MKNLSRLLIVFIIICCFFGRSVEVLASTDLPNTSISKETTEKIEQFVKKQMDEGVIPGLSVVVVKNDQTIYNKGFGYADLEKKKLVQNDTLFEIGSNSKAFTALAIYKLQEEGLVNVNHSVDTYIPWLKMKFEGKEISPSLQQFMNHTSGVPFRTINDIPISDKKDALERTVRNLEGLQLDTKPGESYEYATLNYDVLGLVIEKVTGTSFESYIKEHILKPLELTHTYLERAELDSEKVATGYKISYFQAKKYDAPIYRGNKPAGYFIMDSDDLARWMKLQLDTTKSNEFFSKWIKESHVPMESMKPLTDGTVYAGGWFVDQSKKEWMHGGNNPNYSSYLLLDSNKQIGIGVLSNSNSIYTEAVVKGIQNLLVDKSPSKETSDLNQQADQIAVLISSLFLTISLIAIYFIFKNIYKIIRTKQVFLRMKLENLLGIFISLFVMIGITYCVNQVPNILMDGLSWHFFFVWLPWSVQVAYYITMVTLWICYVCLIISFLKKDKNHKELMILLGFLSFLSGLGNFLIIFSINFAINTANSFKVLLFFALGILLYVGGQRIVRKNLIELTNQIIFAKRMEIIDRLLKTSYEDFEKIEGGRIQATLNNDTETVSRFVNIVVTGITSLATLICCFFYLGFISFYGLLLSLGVIFAIASIYYFAGVYANKMGERARDIENVFFKFIDDLVNGFKELSFYKKRKDEFRQDLEASCDDYRITRGKANMAFANMFVIGELLFTVAIGAIAFIFPLVFDELEKATLTTYIFVLLYMTGPVHGILNTLPNLIEVNISWKRINQFVDELATYNQQEIGNIQSFVGELDLQLDGVEYQYTTADESVFKVGPINYQMKSGEVVFVTGGNGSGKSTLAKLITGLYKPSQGAIKINGKEMDARELSQYCSAIFSDFHLFEKLYGINCDLKHKEIQRYLGLLQMNHKVQVQDGKFNTIKLSTGQKKRLALLVSYLEDKPIYLFDEWAADQDPEFRKFFYDVLLKDLKSRGKCVIAITHDDFYFDQADKTIKMELGKTI